MERHERRRRAERRVRRRRGFATTAMVALSALILAAGLISRLTGTTEVTAQVVATPAPTAISAAFDETPETREIICPSVTWYCIQSGIFSTQEAAEEKSNAYADRGAPGFLTHDGDKYRVLLAAYGDKNDALAVRERLAENQKVETYVHEMTCPELPMRISGMAGQLDVLDAGLLLMPTVAAQMRDLAKELDTAQKSMTDAANEIAAWEEQLTVWSELLSQRFVQPDAPLVGALRGLAVSGHSLTDELRETVSKGQTKLSSTLKLSALRLFSDMRDAWTTLLSQ